IEFICHGTLILALLEGGANKGHKYILVAGDGLTTLPYDHSKRCCGRRETNQDKLKVFKEKVCGGFAGPWRFNNTTEAYINSEIANVENPTVVDIERAIRNQKTSKSAEAKEARKDDYQMVFGSFHTEDQPTIKGFNRNANGSVTNKNPMGLHSTKYVTYGS
ncbi:hypothetical protein MKW98_007293, partial [Papaver atlanticum]